MASEVPEARAQVPEVVGERRKRGRPRRNPILNPNPNPNPSPNPSLGTSRANVINGIFLNGKPSPNPNGANVNNAGEVERDRERVNAKGVYVDLGELAGLEDPFRGELDMRSVGLKTEEEFLGLLGGLSGQWGSRRRKRRVVEAAEFGDVLPRGWKLILSLKKKEGRIWVHVRRYISPSGRHFVTCKEAASYLRSVFGLEGTNQPPVQHMNNNIQSAEGAVNVPDSCYASGPAVNVQSAQGVVNVHTVDPAVNVQSTQGATNVHAVDPAVNVQSRQVVANVHAADPAVDVQSTQGLANVHTADLSVNVQLTQGASNVQSADPAVKNIKGSVEMECGSYSVPNNVSNQKKITSGVSNSVDIQAESILKCEKCNLTFNGQDDLMQHKLSSHRRRRSKFGSSITDGVIIKDGQYECQFCHKTFVERHRYNGHVGAHKRHHMMNDEGLPQVVGSLPSNVDLGSPNQIDLKESIVQAATGDDSDSVNANYGTEYQPIPPSPHCALIVGSEKEVPSDQPHNEVKNMFHDQQEAKSISHDQCLPKSGVDHKVESSLGNISLANHLAAAKFCTSLESEDPMPIDETNPTGDLASKKMDGCLPSLSGQDNNARANIIESEVPVTVADPNLQANSEMISFAVEENEDACNIENDDFPVNIPLEGSTLNPVNSGIKVTHQSSSSSVSASGDQDHVRAHDVDMVSSSVLTEPKRKSFLETPNEVLFGFKNINEGCNPVLNTDTDTAHNRKNKIKTGHEKSASCLNIPQTDKLGDMAGHGRRDFFCTTGATGHGKSSEISNVNLDVRNIARMEPERPKIDKIPTYRSHENAFGVGHQILRPEVRRPEFGLPFLSGNQQFFGGENTSGFNPPPSQQKHTLDNGFRTGNQQFFGGENTSGFNSAPSQQKSTLDNGFRTDNCMGTSFTDVYTMNNRVTNSSMESKPDAALSSGNSGLMIDFGNSGSGIVTNPMDNVPMEQIFFEIDRSRESSQTGATSKQETNLLGPSYYSKPGNSENYLDRIDTGSVWDGPILDGTTGFGSDKLMIGFNNSGAQSHVDPMSANFWRTQERNTYQSNLSGPATQHEGSSSFMNANIIPDKDDDMFLGFNGVQPAPTEHVEFSFMTPHSLDTYPRDTKTIYNSGMAQGFDSSFWFGKDDDLSLNLAARNLVTSICVWCRNEFRHEPENPAAQNGAIGSICPTCSARVSQQFNVF